MSARRFSFEQGQVLLYAHLSKTGGNTVRACLRSAFGVDHAVDLWRDDLDRASPDALRARIAAASGTGPVAIAVNLDLPAAIDLVQAAGVVPDRVTAMITVRSPLERLASLWSFAYATRDRRPLWASIEALAFDIDRILDSDLGVQFADPLTRFVLGPSGQGPLGQAHAERALAALHRDQVMVLRTEHLDAEVPVTLAGRWNRSWTVPVFNPSDHRAAGLPFPPATAERLRRANAADLALHAALSGTGPDA